MSKFTKSALLSLMLLSLPLTAYAQDAGDTTPGTTLTDDSTFTDDDGVTGTMGDDNGTTGTMTDEEGTMGSDDTSGSSPALYGNGNTTDTTGTTGDDSDEATGSNTAVADDTYARDNDAFPWGLLGLLGLAGLAGRGRRHNDHDRVTHTTPNR